MTFTITVTTALDRKRVSDLLCNAFEGGSNYWYGIDESHAPPVFEFYSDPELGRAKDDPPKIWPHLDYPLNAGGYLLISSNENDEINGQKQWKLDLEAIQRGLQIMADKYPHHWVDFQNEDDDGTTGDVFLQCCLFGEVIYG